MTQPGTDSKLRRGFGALIGTVGIVFLCNALSAVVAFLRDITTAAYAGTTPYADALALAFFIPDSLGSNIIGFAAGLSCVPVLTKLLASGGQAVYREALRKALLAFGVGCTALVAVLYMYHDAALGMLGGGLKPDMLDFSERLFLIILPILALHPFAAIGAAALQAQGRFTIPAVGPLLYNTVYLIGPAIGLALAVPYTQGMVWISWSITAGVAAMCALMLLSLLPGSGRPSQARSAESRSGLGEIARLFGPYLAIVLATHAVLYFERYLAAGQEPGTIAALNYAYRLSQLPVWTFAAAVGAVALPAMARYIELREEGHLRDAFDKAIRQMLMVAVPTTILLFMLREPIVATLFQRGAFNEQSQLATSAIAAGYSLTIVPFSLTALALRYYLAAGMTRVPLLAAAFATGATVAADLLLIGRLGPAAIGYGAAIGSAVGMLVLLAPILSRLRLLHRGGKLGGFLLRLAAANAPLVPLCLLGLSLWNRFEEASGASELVRIVLLAGILVACCGCYAAATALLLRRQRKPNG